jgi:hypothetical protein
MERRVWGFDRSLRFLLSVALPHLAYPQSTQIGPSLGQSTLIVFYISRCERSTETWAQSVEPLDLNSRITLSN